MEETELFFGNVHALIFSCVKSAKNYIKFVLTFKGKFQSRNKLSLNKRAGKK